MNGGFQNYAEIKKYIITRKIRVFAESHEIANRSFHEIKEDFYFYMGCSFEDYPSFFVLFLSFIVQNKGTYFA